MTESIINDIKIKLTVELDKINENIKKKELERIYNTEDYTENYGFKKYEFSSGCSIIKQEILPKGHYVIGFVSETYHEFAKCTYNNYYFIDNFGKIYSYDGMCNNNESYRPIYICIKDINDFLNKTKNNNNNLYQVAKFFNRFHK
jgi:hypothetical protein